VRKIRLSLLLVMAWLWVAPAAAQERFITLASTTSTEQSGLFRHILPRFEKTHGIQVRVVALGTGQALDLARRGDADVVLVHARESEEKFVAEGHGLRRYPVMYNDYIVVGPRADPAGIAGLRDAVEALRRIASSQAAFVSRGDRSGTHLAEIALWKVAGIDVGRDKAPWYREIGQGMGPALNTAAAMNAHLLADRGTWIAFRNRQDLVLLVEGDRRLFSQYGVIQVNPERHRFVKADLGRTFVEWLVSREGQDAIGSYRIAGEQLFFGNAGQAGM